MDGIDGLATIAVLAGTAGVLLARALAGAERFTRSRRADALLARGVRQLESEPEHHPDPPATTMEGTR